MQQHERHRGLMRRSEDVEKVVQRRAPSFDLQNHQSHCPTSSDLLCLCRPLTKSSTTFPASTFSGWGGSTSSPLALFDSFFASASSSLAFSRASFSYCSAMDCWYSAACWSGVHAFNAPACSSLLAALEDMAACRAVCATRVRNPHEDQLESLRAGVARAPQIIEHTDQRCSDRCNAQKTPVDLQPPSFVRSHLCRSTMCIPTDRLCTKTDDSSVLLHSSSSLYFTSSINVDAPPSLEPQRDLTPGS